MNTGKQSNQKCYKQTAGINSYIIKHLEIKPQSQDTKIDGSKQSN